MDFVDKLQMVATYYPPHATPYTVAGEQQYGAPVEIPCYIVRKRKQVVTANSQVIATTHMVYTTHSCDVTGALWLGSIGTAPDAPAPGSGVIPIKGVDMASDIANSQNIYTVYV